MVDGRRLLNVLLCLGGVICGGVAVGRHMGVFDGIAAGLVLYAVTAHAAWESFGE